MQKFWFIFQYLMAIIGILLTCIVCLGFFTSPSNAYIAGVVAGFSLSLLFVVQIGTAFTLTFLTSESISF